MIMIYDIEAQVHAVDYHDFSHGTKTVPESINVNLFVIAVIPTKEHPILSFNARTLILKHATTADIKGIYLMEQVVCRANRQ